MTSQQRHACFRRDVTQGHYSNGRHGQPSYHGRNNSQGRQFVRRGNNVRGDYSNGHKALLFNAMGRATTSAVDSRPTVLSTQHACRLVKDKVVSRV
jgi:hypothetical protein